MTLRYMETEKHNKPKLFTSTKIQISVRAALALLDSVQDFPLHAVLQLSPPQHQVEDFVDGMLWILLQKNMKEEEITFRIQTKRR